MSALEILRELKSRSTARKLKKSVPVEWGTSSYLLKVGVENLSRRELVSHLEARDLDTSGTRVQMIERLRRSIREEQMHALAYTDSVDAEFKLLADLEERGSCYAVGCNEYGQLGLGDTEPRAIFTVIPQTRGLQICQLAAVSVQQPRCACEAESASKLIDTNMRCPECPHCIRQDGRQCRVRVGRRR